MRKTILVLCLSLTGLVTRAQDNATEAKAAYLLAEECYGKGDYKCTLAYLKEVHKNLGSTNCKILYLQIMATREMLAKSETLADAVLPLVEEFEKSPDYADFNEEKKLEISKIKLVIRNERKEAIAKAKEKEIADKEAAERNYEATLHSAGGFGITIEELDKSKPTWKVKGWRKKDYGSIQVVYDSYLFDPDAKDYPFIERRKTISTPNAISGILLSDNKIIGYIVQVTDFDESKSFQSSAYQVMKNSVESLKQSFIKSYPGNYRTDHFAAMGNTAEVNDWRRGNCGIKVVSISFAKGMAGVAKLVQVLYCDPEKKLDAFVK